MKTFENFKKTRYKYNCKEYVVFNLKCSTPYINKDVVGQILRRQLQPVSGFEYLIKPLNQHHTINIPEEKIKYSLSKENALIFNTINKYNL